MVYANGLAPVIAGPIDRNLKFWGGGKISYIFLSLLEKEPYCAENKK
jgi:hypothetical protein